MHALTPTHTRTHTHACVHTHTHTHTRTYTHARTRTHERARAHTHAQAHTHTHKHTHTHTLSLSLFLTQVIAVYNDVDSLVREGPTCLGRVAAVPSSDAGFEVSELWPLIGGDLVDGVRNTGLTFCVEEEEEVHRAHSGPVGSISSNRRSCNGYGHIGTHSIAAVEMAGAGQVRYISVSMGKETASRLAVVLENCVAAYDVKNRVLYVCMCVCGCIYTYIHIYL